MILKKQLSLFSSCVFSSSNWLIKSCIYLPVLQVTASIDICIDLWAQRCDPKCQTLPLNWWPEHVKLFFHESKSCSVFQSLVNEDLTTSDDNQSYSHVRACPFYTHTSGVRTGCDLRANRMQDVHIVFHGTVKNSSVRNTFRKELRTNGMMFTADLALRVLWKCWNMLHFPLQFHLFVHTLSKYSWKCLFIHLHIHVWYYTKCRTSRWQDAAILSEQK